MMNIPAARSGAQGAAGGHFEMKQHRLHVKICLVIPRKTKRSPENIFIAL